jgi:predicted AAA+ superfamily ATPase
MPHQRSRALLNILEKRLRLFPVVGVLGARQTGKSTLLRELLASARKVKYITFDREESRNLASRQPSLFLKNLEDKPGTTLCIDEVQKVPALFDTLKAEIDEHKRPGRFALSGSVEFSRKTGITESLTGRIALLRLFPLNVGEIEECKNEFPLVLSNFSKEKKKSDLKSVLRWTERGGLPGIFALRDQDSRDFLFDAWIETTCTRDLAQFKIPRFNPDLARRILVAIAKADNPNRTEIAASVDRMPRQIEPYFEAFKSLFVIYEIDKHRSGVGKSYFYLFDSGMAKFLGAPAERLLQIWFLNECWSQYSYAGQFRPDVFHYESSRKSKVDFVIQAKNSTTAFKLCDNEAPSVYQLRSLEAFSKKNPDIAVYLVAPCLEAHKVSKNSHIIPWNYISG